LLYVILRREEEGYKIEEAEMLGKRNNIRVSMNINT
jgi:hypothetical protein